MVMNYGLKEIGVLLEQRVNEWNVLTAIVVTDTKTEWVVYLFVASQSSETSAAGSTFCCASV